MNFHLLVTLVVVCLATVVLSQDIEKKPIDPLPTEAPCPYCGAKTLGYFKYCQTTSGKVVKIYLLFVKYQECSLLPKCPAVCPFPLVQSCRPYNYFVHPAFSFPNWHIQVQCVFPSSCLCRCDWPKAFAVTETETFPATEAIPADVAKEAAEAEKAGEA